MGRDAQFLLRHNLRKAGGEIPEAPEIGGTVMDMMTMILGMAGAFIAGRVWDQMEVKQ